MKINNILNHHLVNLALKSARYPKHPLLKCLFQLDDESNLYLGNGWKSPNINCKNCSLGYQEGTSFFWFGKAINLKGHIYIENGGPEERDSFLNTMFSPGFVNAKRED